MTRLLVVSDSHGEIVVLKKIIKKMKNGYDAVVHLGDGFGDMHKIQSGTGELYQVSGNMDHVFDGPNNLAEAIRSIELEGIRVLLVHGHRHNVKKTKEELAREAAKQNASLVLYGHTHERDLTTIHNGTVLFNPGAVKEGSYGVIVIDRGKIVSATHYQVAI